MAKQSTLISYAGETFTMTAHAGHFTVRLNGTSYEARQPRLRAYPLRRTLTELLRTRQVNQEVAARA